MLDPKDLQIDLVKTQGGMRIFRITHLPSLTAMEREVLPSESVVAAKSELVAALERAIPQGLSVDVSREIGSALRDALEAIASERTRDFDRSFDRVDEVLSHYGEKNLAARLYADIPLECPWEVVADLFAILIWSTSDNGSSLTETTDEWLREGSDLRKIQIALHLDVCPFRDPAEREQVLTSLAVRFSEVAPTCQQLLASCKE